MCVQEVLQPCMNLVNTVKRVVSIRKLFDLIAIIRFVNELQLVYQHPVSLSLVMDKDRAWNDVILERHV